MHKNFLRHIRCVATIPHESLRHKSNTFHENRADIRQKHIQQNCILVIVTVDLNPWFQEVQLRRSKTGHCHRNHQQFAEGWSCMQQASCIFFSLLMTEHKLCRSANSKGQQLKKFLVREPDEMDCSSLACLLATVSSCGAFFFLHFNRKSWWASHTRFMTDLSTLRWVCGLSSWLCTRSAILSSWCAVRGLPLPYFRAVESDSSIFLIRWSKPRPATPVFVRKFTN